MSKANQNSNVANRLSVANSTERLASIGVRNGETLLQRDTGTLYTWLDTVWVVAGETPVTATPILSGVAEAESEAVIEITIDNYDAAAVYSELTVSGGSAERVDDVVTWSLPTAEEDDTFTISIKAKEAGSLISLSGSHLITITVAAIVTDTPTLSGDVTGEEATELDVTITNYSATATYTISVQAGSYIRTGDTIAWTLPAYTGVDDSHDMNVQAQEPAETISLVAVHTVAVTEEATFPAATGGDITTDGDYKIHTFITSGTFTVSSGGDIEYLLIAGGASGGAANSAAQDGSGGGGAGGYKTATGHAVTIQAYTITIGAGGAGVTTSSVGNDGDDSVFDSITAIGGGGGAYWGQTTASNGGSGGGAALTVGTPGTGTVGQGFDGGSGEDTSAGGGGGAFEVGEDAITSTGGAGGAGKSSSITGSAVTRAGGGGGGTYNQTSGAGGAGGGTAGANTITSSNSSSCAANTGGGSGGGFNSGSGGSGVAIFRYQFQ